MIRLDIRDGGLLAKFERRLNWIQQQQMPFALAKGLTMTARDVREGMKDEIRSTFDSPVQMTVNSVLYRPASKDNLEASVFIRDEATKGTPPVKYLSPQIQGGARKVKRFERALRATGILAEGMFAVPAKGYPLDQHGNIPAGTITRILSELRSNVVDPTQNLPRSRTAGNRGSKKHKRLTRFFAVSLKRGRLPPGIYERWGTKAIRAVMMFVRAPTYTKRFQFYERANQIARRRLRPNLFAALRVAIKTAR